MHTPGPWHIDAEYFSIRTVNIDEPGADLVAFYARRKDGSHIGNANLIAAAPKMLEALQLAEATIERLNRNNSANGTLDVIRAAIAEATGT